MPCPTSRPDRRASCVDIFHSFETNLLKLKLSCYFAVDAANRAVRNCRAAMLVDQRIDSLFEELRFALFPKLFSVCCARMDSFTPLTIAAQDFTKFLSDAAAQAFAESAKRYETRSTRYQINLISTLSTGKKSSRRKRRSSQCFGLTVCLFLLFNLITGRPSTTRSPFRWRRA